MVVDGGTGIGRAAALALAARGDAVVVMGRRAEPLADVVPTVGATALIAVLADVTRPDDHERMLRAATDRFGTLDVLVNSAALVVPGPRVLVNTVVPGPVDADFVDATLMDRLAASALAGRIGRPEDVSRWILAVSDSEASFVTGSTLTVDRGFVIGP